MHNGRIQSNQKCASSLKSVTEASSTERISGGSPGKLQATTNCKLASRHRVNKQQEATLKPVFGEERKIESRHQQRTVYSQTTPLGTVQGTVETYTNSNRNEEGLTKGLRNKDSQKISSFSKTMLKV